MIYVALPVILLYYLAFLLYYRKLFPPSGRRWLPLLLTLAGILAAYTALAGKSASWLNFPIVMLIMAVGLRFSTRMNTLQAVYGGSLCVISAYCYRGLFSALYSLVFLNGELDTMMNSNLYYIITLLALPAVLLTLWLLRRTILTDQRLLRFLNSRGQLGPVVAYELTASANLMIIRQGSLLAPHNQWYMELALGACFLTFGMLMYAVIRAVEVMEFVDYKWRTTLLEEQYSRQLRHYKAYEKYTESFRTFRHDFKAMMSTLKSLIREKENEKAVRLIDEMYDSMQSSVAMHKRYSNHVVLDAMLQDLAELCEENEIRYSFRVHAPVRTGMTTLDAIRIFSNLTTNAVEACLKVPVAERFIDVGSASENGWVTLSILNAFNGELRLKDNLPITTKADREAHGLGISAVRTIVEEQGGLLVYEADPVKKTFLIRVHIPQSQPGPASEVVTS